MSLVNNSVVFVTGPPPDSDERISLDERSSFVPVPRPPSLTNYANYEFDSTDGHNQGSTLGKIRQQNAQFYNRFTETLGHLW